MPGLTRRRGFTRADFFVVGENLLMRRARPGINTSTSRPVWERVDDAELAPHEIGDEDEVREARISTPTTQRSRESIKERRLAAALIRLPQLRLRRSAIR